MEVNGVLTLANSRRTPHRHAGTDQYGQHPARDPSTWPAAGSKVFPAGSASVHSISPAHPVPCGGSGLLGKYYAGDDGGANANFNTFANYSSYFATRDGAAALSCVRDDFYDHQ
jgi:hypothetical protein